MLDKIAATAGRTLRRLRVLMVMLCFATTLNVVPAAPTLASPVCGSDPRGLYQWVCIGADTYTALAFSEKDWSWGSSVHAATQQQAEAIALTECRKHALDLIRARMTERAAFQWGRRRFDRECRPPSRTSAQAPPRELGIRRLQGARPEGFRMPLAESGVRLSLRTGLSLDVHA